MYLLWIGVFACLLRVRKKVVETMLVALFFLPGQKVGSGLLGLGRQDIMADSSCHTDRCFQAAQCFAWQIWL